LLKFVGADESLAFFEKKGRYVAVYFDTNLVADFSQVEIAQKLAALPDKPTKQAFSSSVIELANAALIEVSPIAASGNRMYTIPEGVVAEAKKALEWRKKYKRGGTPVGLNTARTLARGGQIGIRKVRHIAKYFPRHEVDKKGKGWAPGEDKFPSNGRIAWALWGGDAAWRWSRAIVERENRKARTAGGYMLPGYEDHLDTYGFGNYDSDVNPFKVAHELDANVGPEFMARVRMDGSGIDRLYKIDIDGTVSIWDDFGWDDLGHVDGDVYYYDQALDDSEDNVEVEHVLIDPSSAVIISAFFQERPFQPVLLEEIDPEETALMAEGLAEEDFAMIDRVLTAAGEPKPTGAIDPNDNIDTPAEKAARAAKQPKDALGRFAKVGTKVVIADDFARGKGEITAINTDDGTVDVLLENGEVVTVPSNTVKGQDEELEGLKVQTRPMGAPLDMSGILGEPRTPSNRPKAHLPGTLPPMTRDELRSMMYNWDSWVISQRKKFKPLTSAGEPTGKTQTPETSDIPAKYLALVSPDDKTAVMDIVALVPETKETTTPVLYERKDGTWQRNDQILMDLKSSTPPPVVELDDKEVLNDVLVQADQGMTSSAYNFHIFWETVVEPLLAAGGIDRNRGNAETLRRYWTMGKGAAKIRWGTPGDWKRCVRYLTKYMGPRAKGYCQLRHKDATGIYTGSKFNPGRENSTDEFLMGELPGENITQATEVTESDMLIPIVEIMAEPDDLYDDSWEPEDVICKAMDELAKCLDEEFEALIAAGGLDRNRGNAEALRRYWTRGKGALKIRWGTPGDWTRCVRQLSKYMGPRAKGYCQLRHKEVTGVYTGSKFNVGKKRGRQASASLFASEQEFDTAIIQRAELAARAADAREKIGLVAAAPKPAHGARFFIPMLIPEEVESGDGRKFDKGAISMRELPVPLLWQIKTGQGHDGSVVVGRIDYIERVDGGMGNAYGVFDSGPYGREAERLVRHGFLRGVSVDLDQFQAKEDKKPSKETADDGQEYGKDKLTINKARIMAATIVAKPAFQECSILIEESGDQEDIVTPEDGVYEESLETFADVEPIIASGYLESDVPVTPPASWFENPKLTKPTPLTVDKDGRIYGHIAAWHVSHIGLPRSTKPPRSRSKYAYFHTGVIHTAEGMDIPVGQLTLAGGHAPLNVDAAAAAKHYDDTASAVADVHMGEDEYGIWCAGSLRPDVDELQVRALRASAPSGDWRPINGSLELVAVCQVNVPGFPIARAMVASGKIMALVAAGASELAIMKSRAVGNLVAQADMLGQLAASAPNLKDRVREAKKKMREANLEAITASAAEMREKALTAAAVAELAKISEEERMALAEEGKAMPDGSYPIRNVDDLKNAIQAYGRSKASERKAVRKHIIKRARKLRQADLIPSHWLHADSMEAAEKVAAMRAAITAAATGEFRDYSEETREKYAEEGLALPDGSFPIENEEDLKRAIKAHGRAKDIELAKKHIVKRAKALGREDLIPEEWTSKTAAAYVREVVVAAGPKAEEISETELKKLKEAKEEADKQTEEEIKAAEEVEKAKSAPIRDEEGRVKYISGVNQPRDAKGKYRKVLARLKQDLGVAGLSRALKRVEEAENLDFAGDYAASAAASSELLGMIDRLDAQALNPEALENVRLTAAELGKTIANLPLPFGKEAQKVRYSDLPAGLKDLIEGMIDRVESKIGKEDADIATQKLKSYMSGADLFSQGEVQSEMSKLLRLLT